MEQVYEELLGLEELQVNQVLVSPTQIEVHCESKLVEAHCPCCLQKCNFVKQTHVRKVKDLSISGKEVWLYITSRQYVCKECNRHFYEQFSFVDSKESVTKRYAERWYDLSQGIELQYVVVRENLCWQTVNRIFQTYGQSKLNQKQAFAQVSRIGMDEIALKKGHKEDVAVIVDLDTGQVLDLLADRTKQALVNYFQAKGAAFCARIQLFCSDLWEGYLNTAKEVFPNAVIVADRFDFFSRLQKAVDNCRRYLRRKYPKADELKQIKWLLLKNPARLTAQEKQELQTLFAQPDYQLLKATYQAKHTFRAILESDLNRQQAQHWIQAWLGEIEQRVNRFLTDFIRFYTTWKSYILNYFQGRYTTGIIEGINNKIKSIKRRVQTAFY